ncbi:hypothetical protein AMR72_02110 [Flavobacterium psychrophilum]|nr:hypothetical protein AMR72_02110 [Flavobacterium psychrophilum]AOE51421.1 hypothetical protein ALW18_02110 [Flavobacterium psychrophilum]
MKRLIASIALLLIITSYLLSCEKDDLCAEGTPTTPGLVVEFYQYDNTPVLSPVTNLSYQVVGSEKVIDSISGSKFVFPLKADAESVKYSITYNFTNTGGTVTTNTDIFEVKYSRTETFVSRACGYKTTFTLLPSTPENPNFVVTPGTDRNGQPWIRRVEEITNNIDNEDEVHIKFYL